MRILPILFNSEMVQAILDVRKTATRRLVKPQSKKSCGFYVLFRKSDNAFLRVYDYDERHSQRSQIPPCQPGDILYVRENWNKGKTGYRYKADWARDDIANITKWSPSIFMPKEAARIWLKVIDVRVERLRAMTLNDFLSEGVVIRPEAFNDPDNAYLQARDIFVKIWDSTIKKEEIDLYGWDGNPWVWVIEFERCEKPGERM